MQKPIAATILDELTESEIKAIIVGEVMLVAHIVALGRRKKELMSLYDDYNNENKKLRKKRSTKTTPLQEQVKILKRLCDLVDESQALVKKHRAKSCKEDSFTAREIVCSKSFIFYEYQKWKAA